MIVIVWWQSTFTVMLFAKYNSWIKLSWENCCKWWLKHNVKHPKTQRPTWNSLGSWFQLVPHAAHSTKQGFMGKGQVRQYYWSKNTIIIFGVPGQTTFQENVLWTDKTKMGAFWQCTKSLFTDSTIKPRNVGSFRWLLDTFVSHPCKRVTSLQI